MDISKNITKILLCDDYEKLVQYITDQLSDDGFDIESTGAGNDALKKIEEGFVGIVLLDVHLPDMSGLEVFERIRQMAPDLPVVFITAHAKIDMVVEAIQKGAFDFIPKGHDMIKRLRVTMKNASERLSMTIRLNQLEGQVKGRLVFPEIITEHAGMARVLTDIEKVSLSDVPVLITGETGTGKELVARAIHANGPRHDRIFLPVNSAGIPEGLLESEMFGNEKGAYTGAVQARQGLFEQADGGTIFLDEVGELPMTLQAKFLRVLQEGKFLRVGGSREINVNVRVISATNRDLMQEVKKNNFRDDLYYRLAVFPIEIPPLRERGEDITLLAGYFLKQFAREDSKDIRGFEHEALDILRNYSFPGNVRELRNIIRHAILVAKGNMITAADIDKKFLARHEGLVSSISGAMGSKVKLKQLMEIAVPGPDYVSPLDRMVNAYVSRVLDVFNGNVSYTAKALGVTRNTIYKRIDKKTKEKTEE